MAKTISELERELQAMHNPNLRKDFAGIVEPPKSSKTVEDLALERASRGKLPLTQERFVRYENPDLVQWERYTREFLEALSGDRGHRVTAAMIFEWITGRALRQIMKDEGTEDADGRGGGRYGSANTHLRHINVILKSYFGNSYKTTIAGRQVGKAYTVQPGFRVRNKMPHCLTLWPDWKNGTLEP